MESKFLADYHLVLTVNLNVQFEWPLICSHVFLFFRAVELKTTMPSNVVSSTASLLDVVPGRRVYVVV
jgi:hypothetical protein